MSQKEFANVAQVEGSNDLFECTPCGKTISKQSALSHFVGMLHGYLPHVVKAWLVVKDGNALKNNTGVTNRISICSIAKNTDDTHKIQSETNKDLDQAVDAEHAEKHKTDARGGSKEEPWYDLYKNKGNVCRGDIF